MAVNIGSMFAEIVLKNKKWIEGFDSSEKRQKLFTSSSLATVSRWAKYFAAAMASAVTGIIAYTASYEKALVRTVSVAGGGMEELGAKAREMGRITIYSAKETATAMYDLASAGLSVKDVVGAIQPSMHLAAGTAATLTQATSIMATTMKQFSMDADEATRIADVYTYAIQNSKLTMDSLTEAMKFAGPMGAAFRWSIEETTAAVAEFADIGMHGSMAGTHLRMAMMHITAPSEKARKEMEKLGLKMYEVQAASLSFIDTLKLFAQTGLDDPATAGKIFGVRASNDMLAMMRKMREGTLEYEQRLKSLEESSGRAANSYGQMTQNVADKFKILTSAMAELAISIGDEWRDDVVKLLENSLDLVNQLVDAVKNNKDDVKEFFGFFAGPTADAILGLKMALQDPREFARFLVAELPSDLAKQAADAGIPFAGLAFSLYNKAIGGRAYASPSGGGFGIGASGSEYEIKDVSDDDIERSFDELSNQFSDLEAKSLGLAVEFENAVKAAEHFKISVGDVTEGHIRLYKIQDERAKKEEQQKRILEEGIERQRQIAKQSVLDQMAAQYSEQAWGMFSPTDAIGFLSPGVSGTYDETTGVASVNRMKATGPYGFPMGGNVLTGDDAYIRSYAAKQYISESKQSQAANAATTGAVQTALSDIMGGWNSKLKNSEVIQTDAEKKKVDEWKKMWDKVGDDARAGVANMLVGIEVDWKAMAQRVGANMIQGLMRNRDGGLTMFGQAATAYSIVETFKAITGDKVNYDERPEIEQYRSIVSNAEAQAAEAQKTVSEFLRRVNSGEITATPEQVAAMIQRANEISNYDIQDPMEQVTTSKRGGIAGLGGGKNYHYYFANKDAIDQQLQQLESMYESLGESMSNVEGSSEFEKRRESPFTGSGTNVINNLNFNVGTLVADERSKQELVRDIFNRMVAQGLVAGYA